MKSAIETTHVIALVLLEETWVGLCGIAIMAAIAFPLTPQLYF